MRIAVIGNSHLAAYKLGWRSMRSRYEGLRLTFFGSPTTSMRALKVESGCLVPTTELLHRNLEWTSEGLDRVAGDFDAYVLVGMGLSFVHLMAILRTHRPFSIYDPADPQQQLVSDAAFSSFMAATLGNSTGMILLDKLRQITRAPVVYAPNPYPSIGVLGDSKCGYYAHGTIRSEVFEFYKGFAPELVKRGCVLFNQPRDTVIDDLFTKEEYSKGSVKLKPGMNVQHDEQDHFHMNSDFGRVSIDGLMSTFFGVEPRYI